MPNVPYPYEVNWQLVMGNGSLTPICSLSNRSLLPSLTVAVFAFLIQASSIPMFLGYSCALVSDILLQGHLYITENYFAFHSNVFGYVTRVSLTCNHNVNMCNVGTTTILGM